MKVKELMQKLAKADWDAEVMIDPRDPNDVSPCALLDSAKCKAIVGIAEWTEKGKGLVSINMRASKIRQKTSIRED